MPRVVCGLCYLLVLVNAHGHGSSENKIHKLTHAIEKNSADAELYLQRGLAQQEQGQLAESNEDFLRALALQPADYAVARYHLAHNLLSQKQFAKAEAEAKNYLTSVATRNKSIRSNAFWLLGDIAFQQEKFSEAVGHYGEAQALIPQRSPDRLLRHALALERSKRIADAVIVLEQGLENGSGGSVIADKLRQLRGR